MWAALFFVMFFGLLASGMPIFLVLGACAAVLYIFSDQPLIGAAQVVIDSLNSSTLMSLPLFVMAAAFMRQGGVAKALVDLCTAWIGGVRGSLGLVTVVSCTLFAAICGSSVATALAMGTILLPAMLEKGYPRSFALGVIGASGTIGIVVPPSLALILYGIVAEQSVPRLFLAGILPGLVGIMGYLIAVRLSMAMTGEQAKRVEPLPLLERLRATKGVAGVLALFFAVMGGIYLGVFTASEAAGVGAFGAFLIALVRRRLTWPMLYDILVETARMTSTLFLVLFGALLFSNFVNIAGLPADLTRWIAALGANQTAVLLLIVVMYFLMGMVIESISMMLLTVPVFYPLAIGLGVDPIWFGIFVVVAIEISLITPPVGLNVFVLKTVIPDVPSTTVFRGVAPFVAMDVGRILLMIWVPWLALAIPSTM